MKTLLYLSTPGGMTGAPRRIMTLSAALAPHGVNAVIVAAKDTQLFEEAKSAGLNVLELPTSSLLKVRNRNLFKGNLFKKFRVFLALLEHNMEFYRLIKLEKPDFIWFRGAKTFAFAGLGARLGGCKIVWDVDFETPSGGFMGILQNAALRASQALIFQYPCAELKIFTVEAVEKNRPKFHSLIPGIRLSALDDYVRRSSTRTKLPRVEFKILHVGTICDRKNQYLMIEMLAELKRKHSTLWAERRIVLLLAGGTHESVYRSRLITLVRQHQLEGNVEFLEWQDNIANLMVEADVLVLPSKDEGVPNTVQEAMYIGCPVIVGNAGGMPAVVDHGKTGWVLPINKVSPWVALLVRLLEGAEEIDSIVSAAQAYARSNFDDSQWARSYAETLRSIGTN